MPLRLYDYEASGNCYKVRLLLSHLGLDYERVPVDIFAGGTMNGDYGAKNPSLTTPVLELEPGRYLPESAAIMLHLAEGTHLLPEDRDERAQVYRWLFFEQSAVLPTIAMLRFRALTGRANLDDPAEAASLAMSRGVAGVVEVHLTGREYFAGERLTVADLAIFGYLHVAHEAGVDTASLPALQAWVERVRSEPRHVEDLMPYPANSQRGQSQSIYDAFGV
ncbi:MAG: glutathione S-transferase family protein [Gaiellaceae bacterium]